MSKNHGIIGWFVHNRVTPNLIMIIFVLGGIFTTTQIKKEFLPNTTLDQVDIRIAYPGATPDEVETGIVLAVEEAMQSIDGIKEMVATANEGSASVNIELRTDVDANVLYQDIQQAVNSITTFPENAEKPVVKLASTRRRSSVWLQVFGDVDESTMKEAAEIVRDKLLQHPGLSEITIRGGRDYRVWIEVSRDKLRAYNITLPEISRIIGNTALEYSGGSIDSNAGEILLKMSERRDAAEEFGDITVLTGDDGAPVKLRDIATVREGFADSNTLVTWNGKRSLSLSIYRVGDQTPISVSDAVKQVVEEVKSELPKTIELQVARDEADIYRARVELLLKNGFIGLCLVLVLLALFLEYKLAFWVTVGIPTAFLGAMVFLPFVDVSLNMISMFAFIMALGIVVDDAIIAGENIYENRQQGMGFVEAAIQGARDVAIPISFSILTNIMAFVPLMFMPGGMGKMFVVIPMTVITVFILSWIEALFILPAHLAHSSAKHTSKPGRWMRDTQKKIDRYLNGFIQRIYKPILVRCLNNKLIVLASAVGIMILSIALLMSGRMGFDLMPRIEGERVRVTARLPVGAPMTEAVHTRDILSRTLLETADEIGREQQLAGYRTDIEENEVVVMAFLTDEHTRLINATEFADIWRKKAGKTPGVNAIRYDTELAGPGGAAGLTIELTHRDVDELNRASKRMEEIYEEYENIKDVRNSFLPGKQQLSFSIKDAGRRLGLTSRDIATQVRAAFYGVEAVRQQRGRHELRVMARLPDNERLSISDLNSFLIKPPNNGWVPLIEVANFEPGRAYTSISHRDSKRTVKIIANVEPSKELSRMVEAINTEIMPRLQQEFPGLGYGFQGRQADTQDSMRSLRNGFIVLLVALYLLLAIPFKSYIQPLIVMVAIPFGAIGALGGHLMMDFGLSIMSVMGVLALSGVVVNDSLVLVEYSNRKIAEGQSKLDAIIAGATRRFRPIMLTTMTTFGGLAPMIYETSIQAKFLIPMAVSVGFGILFATLITLILVPVLYVIITPTSKPAS
jgi:multidrug efflux pump subunit AcrB